MKLLTITNETQGQRANDFCHATIGEIANFGSRCDRATVDDKCGCARAVVGIDSKKASTTAKITDVDITESELVMKIANGYKNDWMMPENDALKMATSDVKQLVSLGASFEIGTIFEFRGNKIQSRTVGA